MQFDMAALPVQDRYKLMSSSITPRPIAWISSQSAAGIRNAAPYSFFNMMAADPPLIVLGLMRRPDGSYKDSAANIIETGEFVVNLVARADAETMNFTCIDAPPDFDEISMGNIATRSSVTIAPPRIADAPVSMECRLFKSIEAGSASTIILGEVTMMHIADEFVDPVKLHVDTLAMDLIARMHGSGWYTGAGELFQMPRPQYADWVKAGPNRSRVR